MPRSTACLGQEVGGLSDCLCAEPPPWDQVQGSLEQKAPGSSACSRQRAVIPQSLPRAACGQREVVGAARAQGEAAATPDREEARQESHRRGGGCSRAQILTQQGQSPCDSSPLTQPHPPPAQQAPSCRARQSAWAGRGSDSCHGAGSVGTAARMGCAESAGVRAARAPGAATAAPSMAHS